MYLEGQVCLWNAQTLQRSAPGHGSMRRASSTLFPFSPALPPRSGAEHRPRRMEVHGKGWRSGSLSVVVPCCAAVAKCLSLGKTQEVYLVHDSGGWASKQHGTWLRHLATSQHGGNAERRWHMSEERKRAGRDQAC